MVSSLSLRLTYRTIIIAVHSTYLPGWHLEIVLLAQHLNRFIGEALCCTAVNAQMDKFVNDDPRNLRRMLAVKLSACAVS